MSKISGSAFHTKLRELVPTLTGSITPEVLNKLCENDSVQPFLKWFNENITTDNVLSEGCVKLKKHIQKNGNWLKDQELNSALQSATKDCPEVSKLINSDYWNSNQTKIDLSTEKDLYDLDCENLQSIENSIKVLRENEEQLDCALEAENEGLKKEEIKFKLAYEDCISILDKCDLCHRQFSKAVEILANTYSDLEQKKNDPFLWTQIQVELLIKQLKTYSDYLFSYAKRQFSMSQKNEETNLMNESYENEEFKELILCQKNLFSAKIHEIIAKVEEDASKSLLKYAMDIYNDGNLKVPTTPVMARVEIADLMQNRDIKEENITLLQERNLVEMVQLYARSKVVKIMEQEAECRLQRRKDKCEKLERLCILAKENGHAFSTLLCMLLELQIHRINEIISFVADARYYLSMEFSLSSIRNESMHTLQNEYNSLLSSDKDKNSFCKYFMDMVTSDGLKSDLHSAVRNYDEMKDDNLNKLNILLDDKITEMNDNLKHLEERVRELYHKETTSGPTSSFVVVPCRVQNEIDKAVKQVEQIEINTKSVRDRLKNMIKETSETNFDREKLLLWQRFLADPESLKARYKELEELKDHSAF